MKPVVIDFESYYDKEISVITMGNWNYHKKSDAYIVGVHSEDISWCGRIADLPKVLGDSWMSDPEVQPVAANSNFDQGFWDKYYKPFAKPWKCVLDLSGFHQYPRSLAPLVNIVLKRKMDKSIRDEMKGVQFDSLPQERQEAVIDYCLTDCKETLEVWNALTPMSPIEEALAEHTRALNRRGIHVDIERIERDVTLLEQLNFDAVKKIPWSEDAKPLSFVEFCKWVNMNGSIPPKCVDKRDASCEKWIKDNPKLSHTLKSMRLVRGTNSKLKKLRRILSNADGGMMPLQLRYCAAPHTRRWSSTGVNVQNLDAKKMFEDEMAELDFFIDNPELSPGIDMRAYFLPPPGKKFGILDYSQIEPRVLNWLIGNETMLAAIRAGYGIYEAHCIATMPWKGKWSGKPGTLKNENPDLYKFAKIRVLALGYGMGWSLFQSRAALPPESGGIGVVMTEAEARAQVFGFRKSNPLVVGLWRTFDGLISSAARDVRGADPKLLELTLPSGDLLKHYHVCGKGKERGFHSYTIRGDFSQESHQPRLWGGTLVENVVQRIARDILGFGIMELEKQGFPTVFHAHDEVILAFDESSAKSDIKDAEHVMSTHAPEWAEGLPLGVEGSVHDHYVKLK